MDHYLDNPDRWAYRRAYAERNYPAGTRIRLLTMPDDPNPIPAGTCGTVVAVDDAGQLLMQWDNGSGLNVVYGEDMVRKLSRPEDESLP